MTPEIDSVRTCVLVLRVFPSDRSQRKYWNDRCLFGDILTYGPHVSFADVHYLFFTAKLKKVFCQVDPATNHVVNREDNSQMTS